MWSPFRQASMPAPDRALPGRAEPMPSPDRHFVNGAPIEAPLPEGSSRPSSRWAASGAPRRSSGGCPASSHGRRLRRRLHAEPDLSRGLLGPDRARRSRARGFDPDAGLLRAAAEGVLGAPRPDAGHAPGQRRRDAVPVGDLLRRRRAAPRRGGLARCSTRPRCQRAGYGAITTEIAPAPPFYYAEDYHQQYLAKNPDGYCPNHATGVKLPNDFVVTPLQYVD